MVHCDTVNTRPLVGPAGYGDDSSQNNSDGQEKAGYKLLKLFQDQRELAFRRKLGKMLADGDCKGAAQTALKSGRLELGQSIMASCLTGDDPTRSPDATR